MDKFNCVLLVDDDETSNFLNENIIADLKLAEHVHAALNGKEALLFIRQNCEKFLNEELICPSLVLLDINMPVMDGFEFLEKYNQLEERYRKKIQIIMLTSSQSEKDINKSRSFNVKGYIDKPLTEEKLMKVLEHKGNFRPN